MVVAIDDPRIEAALAGSCVRTVLTRKDHVSGTERVAELIQKPDYACYNRILNVQGDQLYLPKEAAVGALYQLERGLTIGTAAAPLLPVHELDRNRVKVSVDEGGRARLFSRQMPVNSLRVFLHLGVYSYTRDALLNWVSLSPCQAEFDEGLEQLRPFQHGIPIGVSILDEPAEPGIDTPQDLSNAQHPSALTRTNA